MDMRYFQIPCGRMIYRLDEHPKRSCVMCGRYSLVFIDDLGNRFRVFNPMIGSRSRFNIAPGNEMPVIIHEGKNELVMMKWGLVPRWTQDITAAKRSINARAETLSEKPSFAELLKNQRCLVPASGFFEWKNEGKKKVPFSIHLPKIPIFAFAGLYDQWADSDGNLLRTYTIITTKPNELIAKIHNRMPSILMPESEDRWLSKTPLNAGDLKEILAPFPAGRMSMYPVSSLVNTPDVDDERVIRPLNTFSSTPELNEDNNA
jgi:putative SOS response-associated peptidase YedK